MIEASRRWVHSENRNYVVHVLWLSCLLVPGVQRVMSRRFCSVYVGFSNPFLPLPLVHIWYWCELYIIHATSLTTSTFWAPPYHYGRHLSMAPKCPIMVGGSCCSTKRLMYYTIKVLSPHGKEKKKLKIVNQNFET